MSREKLNEELTDLEKRRKELDDLMQAKETVAKAGRADQLALVEGQIKDAERVLKGVESRLKREQAKFKKFGEDMEQLARGMEGRTITLPGRAKAPAQNVTIGRYIGKGTNNMVFEIQGRPDELIKFAVPTVGVRQSPGEIVRQTVLGRDRLLRPPRPGDGPIEHAEILAWNDKADVPYHIAKKQDFKPKVADPGEVLPGERYEIPSPTERGLFPEEQIAVIKLHENLAKQGLIWADSHGGNIYLYRDAKGALKAGILDTDRLGMPTDPGPLGWIKYWGNNPKLSRIESLKGTPNPLAQLRDPETFMRKMLEQQKYIKYTGVGNPPYEGILLDPKLIEQHYFPKGGASTAPSGKPSSLQRLQVGPRWAWLPRERAPGVVAFLGRRDALRWSERAAA